MQLLTVSGTHYEMGVRIGEAFGDYLQQSAAKMEKRAAGKPGLAEWREMMAAKLADALPDCLDELYGWADGADISRENMLLMSSPELFFPNDGCTTLVLKKTDGSFLFSHNEDQALDPPDNTALIRYQYPDHWTVCYATAPHLPGSTFGYNSFGMVFASNFIFETDTCPANVSRYVLERDVMESADMADAVRRLSRVPSACAFSINILDKNSRRAVNIEKDLGPLTITEIDDRFAHANHFLTKTGRRPVNASSAFRYAKTKALLDQLDADTAGIADLKAILDYHTGDYGQSVYKDPASFAAYSRAHREDVTFANFAYDEAADQIRITDYLGASVYASDYHTF